MFDAADQPIVIAVGTDAQWQAAARALGLSVLADDPALATNAGRVGERQRVSAAIAAAALTRPAAEWVQRLGASGVPCGVVKSVRQALADRGVTKDVGLPLSAGGRNLRPAPGLDAHGERIRRHQWSAFDHVPIPAFTSR
jgi:crotonobetainyl-CoA:carnitine CoA-transferase CaiB-like acyl-CoA transferase